MNVRLETRDPDHDRISKFSLDAIAIAPVLTCGLRLRRHPRPDRERPEPGFPATRDDGGAQANRLDAEHPRRPHLGSLAARPVGPDRFARGPIRLVGSHGSEFDLDFSQQIPPEAAELLEQVIAEVKEIAGRAVGAHSELKPASVAFHYRNVRDQGLAKELAEAILRGPAARSGVYTRRGKMVLELAVVPNDKGRALEMIRAELGASAVVYLGDDVTDEDAFRTLRGPDIGIKVGEGESLARTRLADTDAVSRYLAALAEARGGWLAGSHSVPIERHSLLSDQRSLALVTDRGRISWFCTPRLDSPASFADLVGGPTAGYFAIESEAPSEVPTQAYEASSMSLRTTWKSFHVIDYLDCSSGRPRARGGEQPRCSSGRPQQRAGRTDLVRRISGSGTVRIEYAPRLDFGRTRTRIRVIPNGLEVEDSLDFLVLRSPGVDWHIREEGPHHTAVADLELGGEAVVLEMRCGTRSTDAARIPERDRREQTNRHWSRWADELRIPDGDYADAIRRNALILKALCFAPTGGIAAAATTSLPESPGGIRNWDYRYTWLRDAAMTASTLTQLGSLGEGLDFVDWLLGVLDRGEGRDYLRPVYGVDGHELGIEAELGELRGYMGSRPVRIGNAAARQLQLDVYGPLLELMLDLLKGGAALSADHWRFVTAAVTAVSDRWAEPDHGIWEVRGDKRHYLHSKVMCWVTVDRAIEIGRALHMHERPEWEHLRDEIAADVLRNGWKESVQSFAAAYDGTDIDAAALVIGLAGMIDATDPRFAGTVRAVEHYLRDGVAVYRYRYDDGLPGVEGGFLICTSWLIDSYILQGRLDEAQSLFAELSALAGPTGLMCEEFDPHKKLTLGNVPQAYTHIGVIRNALNLIAANGRATCRSDEHLLAASERPARWSGRSLACHAGRYSVSSRILVSNSSWASFFGAGGTMSFAMSPTALILPCMKACIAAC